MNANKLQTTTTTTTRKTISRLGVNTTQHKFPVLKDKKVYRSGNDIKFGTVC